MNEVKLSPALIGRRLRYFRQRAQTSQLELEATLGAPSGFISRIESGEVNPTKESILKIAKAVGMNNTEIDYVTGITSRPATKAEIELALAETKALFQRPGFIGYMIDDRGIIVNASIEFCRIFHIGEAQRRELIGKNILKIALGDESFFKQYLWPDSLIDLAKHTLIRFKNQMGHMVDDPEYLAVLDFIKSKPQLKFLWDEINKESHSSIHTAESRKVIFTIDGQPVEKSYAVEKVLKYPRFEVIEYP